MDKEFLDKVLACKTADELRALLNSRRQLSDGELEQVTGGAINSTFGVPEAVVGHAYIAEKFVQLRSLDAARDYIIKVMGLPEAAAEDLISGGAEYMLGQLKKFPGPLSHLNHKMR